jgi:NMD protein affecting ribosome stability and mRNA decay
MLARHRNRYNSEPKERVMRRCLKCGREFPAKGRFHRVCKTCSSENKKVMFKPHKKGDEI